MTIKKQIDSFYFNIGQFKNIQDFRNSIFKNNNPNSDMNPSIRYQQPLGTANNSKFSYDRASSNNHNVSDNAFKKQINQEATEPHLTKHKSSNFDVRFYQQTDFTKSYRMEQSSFTKKQQNRAYKATTANNFYVKPQLHKSQSANDFFNNTSDSPVKKQQYMKKQHKKQFQTFSNKVQPTRLSNISAVQHIPIAQVVKQNTPPTIIKQIPQQQQCTRCHELMQQNQQMMRFMREQLQIGAKQYSDRMSKVIIQQAKQIKDLRKILMNTERNVIRIQKQFRCNFSSSQKIPCLIKDADKSFNKSTSKLSLTKSSHSRHSVSPYSKQKIKMVSKQISPSKNQLVNTTSLNRKYSQNQALTLTNNNRMSSTARQTQQSEVTEEQIIRNIKKIEERIQLSHKMQNQRNQKVMMMNKRIQILEKSFLGIFAGKIQKVKINLNHFMLKQDQKVSIIYKQLRVISSRVGSMVGSNANPLYNQTITNGYSSPKINLSSSVKTQSYLASNPSQLNTNKISVRLNNFSAQLQDLKQLSQNLQTREFKYDNFQIEGLANSIQEIQKRVYNLQKEKYELSSKIVQNQQHVVTVTQMSKLLRGGSDLLRSDNQVIVTQGKLIRGKINPGRKRNVELSYSINDNPSRRVENISKSMKNQSLKLTKHSKVTSQDNSHYNSHTISQSKGSAQNQSGFSQFIDNSIYFNEYKTNLYNNQQEQSFERSSSDGEYQHEQQQEQQEQDQFFYPLDVSSQASNGNNGQSSSIVNASNNKNYTKCSQTQNYRSSQHPFMPNPTIHRFMEVIEYRQNKPLRIEIDQTGYIKSAQNGMYIVDRNMDGFDLSKAELQWLNQKGIINMQP